MTSQCLQRLLLDRALKELPEDTAELLDTYISDHVEAAAEMKEMEESLRLARSALRKIEPALSDLPPLRISHMPLPRKTFPYRWIGPMSLAASLFLGFWLGNQSAVVTRSSHGLPQAFAGRIENAPQDFWSIKNYAERSERAGVHPAIHWTSPLARPEIGVRS